MLVPCNHESRFNLFGLINQQYTMYMSVAGLERMTTGSVAKRLILSRHTGRQNIHIIHYIYIIHYNF